MKRTTTALATTLAFAASLATSASAATIYEQSSHDTADRGAFQYFGQELADDFSLANNSTLDSLTWRGSYYGADNLTGTESFTVNIYSDAAGLPSLSSIYSFTGIASFVASSTATYYDYALDVTDFALAGGTTYWISILSNESPSNYAWANSHDGSSEGAVRDNGGSWRDLDNHTRTNHVFALESQLAPVPLPATGLLLLGAVAGIGVMRRRKRS